MGLIVYVYRTAGLGGGDCTNGGISADNARSARHDSLCVVNVDGPFEPTAERPAVALVDGPLGTKHLVPVLNCAAEGETPEWQQFAPEGHAGPMAGGNYAASSDSRWSKAVGFYGAVAIHDRYETWAQYDALSR